MLFINGRMLNSNHFPDGTLALMNMPILQLNELHVTIEWQYENDSELVTLYYITRHYQSQGYDIELYMDYLPNARQDRVKNDNEVFTLKWFAEIINSLNFRSVTVRDIHSNVGTALINNIEIDNCKNNIEDTIETINCDNLLIFYPDEGSVKRYSDIINKPYAFGIKKRDWKTGKILGLDVIDNGEKIKDRTILIVDDICSKGGTFYHSAKKLKELGAGDIYLYITHCENTILDGEIIKSGLIKHIYTTDSIFTKEHELITVL